MFRILHALPFITVLLLCGCFPVTTTYMEIDYSTDNVNYIEEAIQISDNPQIIFQSEGCGRSFGLVSPPVIFDIVTPLDTNLLKNEVVRLVVDGKELIPLIFEESNVGQKVKKRKYSFNELRCSDLKKASYFNLSGLMINQMDFSKMIWLRYNEHTKTEIQAIPSGIPH